jgi:hypothetical protein
MTGTVSQTQIWQKDGHVKKAEIEKCCHKPRNACSYQKLKEARMDPHLDA